MHALMRVMLTLTLSTRYWQVDRSDQPPPSAHQTQRETPITMVSMYPPHKFCLDATSQLSLSLGPLSLLCG